MRPKSVNTKGHVECVVRKYLVPRFGDEIAEDVRTLDIQRWLKSLHTENGLQWPTISKMRGIMRRIYKVGIVHGQVSRNPVEHVETRSKSDYRAIVITPEQTLATLNGLPSPLHFALVLTCAATALRVSEIIALRWADVLWEERRIRVSKRWAKGQDGETKTEASDGFVPVHPVFAAYLRLWHRQTPYAKDTDFVFPSFRAQGQAFSTSLRPEIGAAWGSLIRWATTYCPFSQKRFLESVNQKAVLPSCVKSADSPAKARSRSGWGPLQFRTEHTRSAIMDVHCSRTMLGLQSSR